MIDQLNEPTPSVSCSFNILFVDDDHQVAEFLGSFCSSIGVDHDIATSGPEAMEKLKKSPYALVVTDLRMPGMDGFALGEAVRSHHPGVGLFAFTGETGTYPMAEVREIFDQVFLKPNDYSRMIAEALKYLAVLKYPFLA